MISKLYKVAEAPRASGRSIAIGLAIISSPLTGED